MHIQGLTPDSTTRIELGEFYSVWPKGISMGSHPECTIVLPELAPIAARAVGASNHKFLCHLPEGTSFPLPQPTGYAPKGAQRIDAWPFQLGPYTIRFEERQEVDRVGNPLDDSDLAKRLPGLSMGFGIAIAYLVSEVVGWLTPIGLGVVPHLLLGCGWLYWLYCVHKYHDVASKFQGYDHSIHSGRAVAMHLVPFYNLYWIFKWPKELANLVNWRTQSGRSMNGTLIGTLFFAGLLLLAVDGGLSLLVMFGVSTYISKNIRTACLAKLVPKDMRPPAPGSLGL